MSPAHLYFISKKTIIMATIKIKFRSSSVAGKEGTLCYQVIHGRQTRLISTGYKLHLYEWDKEAGKIRSVKGNPDRERYLEALRFRMEEDQKRLNGIIRKLEQSGKLSSEQIVLAYHSPEGHDDCFFVYARKVIDQTKRMGKERTSEVYASSLNSFIRFGAKRRCTFGCDGFRHDDGIRGLPEAERKCPNTVSFTCAICVPYIIGHRRKDWWKTAVRSAMSIRELRRRSKGRILRNHRTDQESGFGIISGLGFRPEPVPALLLSSRHVFRGLGFLEKKKDLQNGVLVYRRHKTDQQLCIKWEQPMQEIVRKYTNPDSPYLLPIIKVPGERERRQYLNASHVMNKRLQKIGRMVECPIKLTFLCRKAWVGQHRQESECARACHQRGVRGMIRKIRPASIWPLLDSFGGGQSQQQGHPVYWQIRMIGYPKHIL